uniref:WD repeat-containing protein 74 n=1 Tax=Myxine glutinosa TaxID=7769 RepID=UPI00358F886B
MARPVVQHVWLGAQTGILKGVNLVHKNATNFSDLQSLSRDHEVCAMCWADTGEEQIHLACRNGSVKTFDTGSAGFVSERDCTGGEGTFRGVATWGSSLITCVQSGLLKVWEEDPLNQVELEVGRGVHKMRQNPENPQVVATGGKENDLKIWDLQNPLQPVFKAKNVRNDWLDLRVPVWIMDMQFLPQSEKIVTCTAHYQVRVYDQSGKQRRPILETTFDEFPLTSMALTPQHESVVVGNTHGQVAVIDLRRGMVGCCLKGFVGSVTALQCHKSLPLVASCGLDRFMRVHDLRNKRLLHKVYLKSRLNCLLLTSKENWEVEPAVDQHLDAVQGGKGEVQVKEEEEDKDDLWESMEKVSEEKIQKRQASGQTSGNKRKMAKRLC